MKKSERRRGQKMLVAQADRNPPLGEPASWLTADAVEAWHEIAKVAVGLRQPDEIFLATVAMELAVWRRGYQSAVRARALYRALGKAFVPMAARRSLLFGANVPASKSNRR